MVREWGTCNPTVAMHLCLNPSASSYLLCWLHVMAFCKCTRRFTAQAYGLPQPWEQGFKLNLYIIPNQTNYSYPKNAQAWASQHSITLWISRAPCSKLLPHAMLKQNKTHSFKNISWQLCILFCGKKQKYYYLHDHTPGNKIATSGLVKPINP